MLARSWRSVTVSQRKPQQMATILITDATASIQKFLDSQGSSDLTIRAYKSDVLTFARDMGLTEFSLDELEHLAASWLNKYRRIVAPKTTNRRLTSMRTLGKAYEVVILKNYHAPTPDRPKPHPLPNGRQDLSKMLDECSNDSQRMLLVLTGMCGLRIGEALSLRPQDINLKERTIKVWGKGSKIRTVPISDTAWDMVCASVVEAMLDGKAKLLGYADRSARMVITTLAERAGIGRPVASHDLRATFATEAYVASGYDLRVVQELLGHASPDQTQIYVERGDEARRNAVNFMEASRG